MEPFLENFCTFLKQAPTSYHTVEEIKAKLSTHGFNPFSMNLKKGGRYYYAKEGSCIAFKMPEGSFDRALIYASHTDSPALKLKPEAEFTKEGMNLWGVEIYGSPLLSSWLNRDLGVAGKILFQKEGKIQEALVQTSSAVATIPQLAIHLDREVNDKGLILNKQEHLTALAPKKLASLFHIEPIAHDLFLYPVEEPKLIGDKYLASYRLDNLASVYAICEAFLEKNPKDQLHMIAFFDHEEIGSSTASGAESPFFSHVLERIAGSREAYFSLIENSLCVSVDLWHAVHPNYPEKHDPQHKPALGQGILIKTNAQKRYATDTKSIRPLIETLSKEKIPFKIIASRNDIPSGTTLGPIQAAMTGISTVDIGIGQLSMHSARELIAYDDLVHLKNLLVSLAS